MAQSIYSPMRDSSFTYRNCHTLLYLQKGYLDKQKMKSVITATLKKLFRLPRNLISHCNVAGIKRKRYHAAHRTGVTQLTGKYYSFAVPFLGLLGAL